MAWYTFLLGVILVTIGGVGRNELDNVGPLHDILLLLMFLGTVSVWVARYFLWSIIYTPPLKRRKRRHRRK